MRPPNNHRWFRDRAAHLCGGRAVLVARPSDLIEVLIHPKVVELASLAEALGRRHGRAWGRKAAP